VEGPRKSRRRRRRGTQPRDHTRERSERKWTARHKPKYSRCRAYCHEEGLALNDRLMALERCILACVVAAVVSLAQPPFARAQEPPAARGGQATNASPTKADLAAAKKHYGDGEKKYKVGDYAGALADFKAANEVKSTPQAERYIGLCEDALGHFSAAVESYEKFLAHVPDKMTAQGEEIHKRSAEIKQLPGKVHVDSNPPGAAVTIDERPQGAPTPMDVELAPGTHSVRLTAEGRLPTEKQIDVAFASSQTIRADLDPAPPPAPAPIAASLPASPPAIPPPASPHSLAAAFVTGGLAVVAAGVGTVFGVMALNDKSDFDKNPTTHTADNGDTHALISDMSFGVALTFGITSAVLLLTSDEPPAGAPPQAAAERSARKAANERKGTISIVPTPLLTSHSAGAGVLLRF